MDMKLLAVSHFLLHFLLNTDACTEIRITAEDSTVIIGRSMEYEIDGHSDVIRVPEGEQHTADSPLKCKAAKYEPMTWTNIKSILYIDGLKMRKATDGQNAAGLSVGALLFPGFAKYQDVPLNKCGSAISQIDFPLWILGNFETVQELRDALEEDSFPLVYMSLLAFEAHYSVTDKTGDGIIIEYSDEGRKVHNNTVGVVTNAPSYDWHMLNLRNYIGMSNYNYEPWVLGKEELTEIGQGSGLLGIPGDLTPPSRLVRAAFFVNFAAAVKTSDEAVNLAIHIMNAVDIPLGLLRIPGKKRTDYTQWIVIKDLKNNVMYFRGYEDVTLYRLRLDDDFSSIGSVPIDRPLGGAVDITNEFTDDGHTEL